MSDKPTRSGGGSGLATLPEWPEEPKYLPVQCAWECGKHTTTNSDVAWQWYHYELAEAALKRVDALVELLKRYRNETPLGHQPHMIAHKADALLAACERRSGG